MPPFNFDAPDADLLQPSGNWRQPDPQGNPIQDAFQAVQQHLSQFTPQPHGGIAMPQTTPSMGEYLQGLQQDLHGIFNPQPPATRMGKVLQGAAVGAASMPAFTPTPGAAISSIGNLLLGFPQKMAQADVQRAMGPLTYLQPMMQLEGEFSKGKMQDAQMQNLQAQSEYHRAMVPVEQNKAALELANAQGYNSRMERWDAQAEKDRQLGLKAAEGGYDTRLDEGPAGIRFMNSRTGQTITIPAAEGNQFTNKSGALPGAKSNSPRGTIPYLADQYRVMNDPTADPKDRAAAKIEYDSYQHVYGMVAGEQAAAGLGSKYSVPGNETPAARAGREEADKQKSALLSKLGSAKDYWFMQLQGRPKITQQEAVQEWQQHVDDINSGKRTTLNDVNPTNAVGQALPRPGAPAGNPLGFSK